jgi:uncharacterized membrane protein
MKRKHFIIAIVTIILAIAGAILGITYTEEDIKEISEGVETIVEIVDNQSTTEIPELTKEDEEALEYQETEAEGFELQGEIAYNGASELPKVEVGEYAGLTYYSQTDSRWKNKPYTAIGDKTQTMGSSACGPTCSAMVVSSIKGTILPPDMADLYIKYGFRSANNGTYWSAFRWTADVFDIGYKEIYKLNEVCDLLEQNYMCISACGNGLFTTGGHFILIYGYEDTNGDGQCDAGDRLKIYDPYLYNGKFNTSTRRGKATVDGNTVLVEKETFRAYANYSIFFAFKNDRTDIKENTTTVTTKPKEEPIFESYNAKVTAKSGLNARTGASTGYARVSGYGYGKIITIVAESNGWGKTTDGYWVCLQYTTKTITGVRNTVGQYKRFKTTYTYIYSKNNLSGNKYYYLKNTKVKILENVSANVDRIYVPATGRYGYVSTSVYK